MSSSYDEGLECWRRVRGSVWISWGEADQALSDSVDMMELYTTSSLTSQGAWSFAGRVF